MAGAWLGENCTNFVPLCGRTLFRSEYLSSIHIMGYSSRANWFVQYRSKPYAIERIAVCVSRNDEGMEVFKSCGIGSRMTAFNIDGQPLHIRCELGSIWPVARLASNMHMYLA